VHVRDLAADRKPGVGESVRDELSEPVVRHRPEVVALEAGQLRAQDGAPLRLFDGGVVLRLREAREAEVRTREVVRVELGEAVLIEREIDEQHRAELEALGGASDVLRRSGRDQSRKERHRDRREDLVGGECLFARVACDDDFGRGGLQPDPGDVAPEPDVRARAHRGGGDRLRDLPVAAARVVEDPRRVRGAAAGTAREEAP
jgi:hypothetical protein